MKFQLDRKINPNVERYRRDDLSIVYRFTKDAIEEFDKFLKAVVLFGSAARRTKGKHSDLDVLMVIDDLTLTLTPELTEAYRVIVQKLIAKHSTRLHITTLRFSSLWEYIRNGDPIAINMLRDGLPILDTGFFEPLQALLKRGRIRPSAEAIWTYFVRAPNTLHNSKWHILQATVDLYWAVIDSAHAALMKHGEIPPSPDHVADLMQEKLVKPKLIEAKYVKVMRNFYRLSKMITHRELREIKGHEYDKYYKEASEFVERMRTYIGWNRT